ncbi:hypothetical protein D4764_0165960 [Takifugu flavidus]|uniref:Uncharacterized protein n=1 Tax=Takifugu flavidus TaxID=433684 RepID=A0A5C6MEG9_9TELE|nr:hypothetical protein D4764_0165960 [Takifugu flavidus]
MPAHRESCLGTGGKASRRPRGRSDKASSVLARASSVLEDRKPLRPTGVRRRDEKCEISGGDSAPASTRRVDRAAGWRSQESVRESRLSAAELLGRAASVGVPASTSARPPAAGPFLSRTGAVATAQRCGRAGSRRVSAVFGAAAESDVMEMLGPVLRSDQGSNNGTRPPDGVKTGTQLNFGISFR